MKSSILSQFLTRWVRRRPLRKGNPYCQPRLEQLEERCCPSAYSSVVLANAPALYYQLHDLSGTTMTDSSGTNSPGTYNSSGITYNTGGAIYNSYGGITLNGTNGYAQLGKQNAGPPFGQILDPFLYPSVSTTAYSTTFETWFKTSPSSFNGSWGNAFSSNQLALAANWAQTSGSPQAPYTWTNPTLHVNDTFTVGAPNVNDFIGATGQTISISAITPAATLDILATNTTTNLTGQNFVVTFTDGGTQTLSWSLSQWNAALAGYTDEYAAGTSYLDFNGGSGNAGTHLNAYSFNLNDPNGGNIVQSITLASGGVNVNGNVRIAAINLDTGTNSTSINLNSSFNQIGIVTDASSFLGGVILGQIGAGGNVAPGVAGSPQGGYIPALYVNTNGYLYGYMFNGPGQMISPLPVDDGNWHYAALTYTNGVETMYIDGVAVATKSGPENPYNVANGYDYFLGTGYSANYIGQVAFNGWSFFKGSLDEAAVYNTALTPTQVETDYLTGIGHVSNLSVTDTPSVTNAAAGSTVTYTIVVTNSASLTQNGINVTDPFLAAQYSGDTWTATYSAGSSGLASGSGSINTLVNLAPSGTATFIVNATLSASATNPTKNTATATASGMTPSLSVVPGYDQNTLSWADGWFNSNSPSSTDSTTSLPATYNIYRGTSSGNETLIASGVTGTSYVDPDASGNTYYYEVTAVYPYTGSPGNYESPRSNEASGTPITGTLVPGLTTQYYNDGNGVLSAGNGNYAADATVHWLSADKVGAAVIEPNVNNNDYTNAANWGGTPNNPNYLPTAITTANGGANYFSVQWTGYLLAPVSGNYVFSTGSDDGSYLFVNGTLVVNNGYYQGVNYISSGSVYLTAGQLVPIEMQYYQGGGGATAYLDWNISGTGRVVIPAADLFTGTPTIPAAVPASATFVKTDTTTLGNWMGTYGAAGYYFQSSAYGPANQIALPPGTGVSIANENSNGYNSSSTTNAQYLQMPLPIGTSNRIMDTWFGANNNAGTSYTVTVSFTDAQSHQVALYFYDANGGRAGTVQAIDPSTGTVLSTQTLSGFTSGKYLVFNVTGKVEFVITNTVAGNNVTLAGIFFGGGAAAAPYPTPSLASFWTPEAVTSSNTVTIGYPQTTLSVTKTANASVTAGDQVTYTVTVHNNSATNTAYYVNLNDVLPTGETFVSDQQIDSHGNIVTSGASYFAKSDPAVGAAGTINDSIFSLAPGATANFDWTVLVLPKVTAASLSNTVIASAANAGVDIDSGSSTSVANFVADTDVTGGSEYSTSTAIDTSGITNNNPAPQAVYQTDRYGSSFTYTIPSLVKNGVYNVLLDFAELQPSGGADAIFNVSINGTTVLTNFDIGSAAAALNKAIDKSFLTTATSSGNIVIVFTGTGSGPSNYAEVNGIQISAASTATTTVDTQANLTVTKTAVTYGTTTTTTSVTPGNYLSYTVTITNSGPSDAQNVYLNDVLPTSETFVSDTQNGATSGNTFTMSDPTVGTNGTIDDTLATLAAGASASFTWTVAVNANATGSIANTVNAGSSTDDITGNPASATSTATVSTTTTPPNLTVTKTVNSGTVAPGGQLTYTVVLTNSGNNNATNVTLADPLPAGETIVSAKQTAGSPTFTQTISGGTITENFSGTMFQGQSVTFTYVVNVGAAVPVGTVLKNIASDNANNRPTYTSEADTTVNYPPTSITVAKSGSPGTVTAGNVVADTVTYTITVKNTGGTNPAYGITLTDPLPAGETFTSVGALPAGWTDTLPTVGSNGTVTFTAPASSNPLATGATDTLTIVATVPASTQAGTLKNIVTANSSNLATKGNVLTSEADTTVKNSAVLSVAKTATTGSVYAGNTDTYNISLTNSGPSYAFGTSLTDPLPKNFTVAAGGLAAPTGWFGTTSTTGGGITTVTFAPTAGNLTASMAPGTLSGFQIVAKVPSSMAAGTYGNVATGKATDATSASNAPVNVKVTDQAVLSLAKSVATTGSIYAGGNLTYTLVLTNSGPSDAFDATLAKGPTITDVLPAGMSFVGITGTLPAGWAETTTGQTLTFTDSNPMAPGTSGNLSFKVLVAPTYTGASISNSASASASDATSVTSNTVTNSVSEQANLAVTMSAPPGASPNKDLVYTVTVTNNGLSDAYGANVTVPVPGVSDGTKTTFVSATLPSPAGGWSDTLPAVGSTGGNVVFSNSDFAPGTTTFTVTVLVPSAATNGSTISNTATASATDATTVTSSPATVSTVSNQSSLAVTLAGSPTPNVAPGTDLTYTATIQNGGPADAFNTTLTVPIPAGTTFVSASLPSPLAGWSDSVTSGNVIYSDADLPYSATATTFTVVVQVTATSGTITNKATGFADNTGPGGSPGSVYSSTVTTNVVAQANLAVSMSGSPSPVVAGTDLTYTVNVNNNAGPNLATNATVSVPVPANSTFVSYTIAGTSSTGWTESGSTPGYITFTNASLPVSGTGSFTVVVQVASSVLSGSTITDVATASASDMTTPVTSGNVTTTVSALAVLNVTKTAPVYVIPGTQLTYNISITNSGPSDAQTVVLTDPLPSGAWGSVTFASQSNPGGTWTETDPGVNNPGTVTFSDPTLAAGATATFSIIVNVPAATPYKTVLTNTVTATTATTSTGSTLSATATTTVQNVAQLAIAKMGPTAAAPGQTIFYTLTLTNSGPNNAFNASITDVLPAGTTLVSVGTPIGWTETGPAVGKNGTVTFSDPSFPVGTVFFTIGIKTSASIFTTATLTNTASVIADDIPVLPPNINPVPLASNTVTTTVTPTANEQYVYNVYEKLLGRAPDPSAASWVTALNNGLAPTTFVADIESSQEYLTDQVGAMYLHYLGRAPDAAGLAAWVGQLQAGATLEQVAASLVSSPEYFADHGSNNTSFVQALYQDILGRPADAAGLASWVAFLNNGEVRNGNNPSISASLRYQVAMAFLTSTEYQGDLIQKDYQTFLYRPADLGGLVGWENAMKSGLSDQAVLAAIFGSAEGYLKNS